MLLPALLAQIRPQPMPQPVDSGFGIVAVLGFLCCYLIIPLAIYGVVGFGFGKTFEKAGKPLWAGFVPVYNGIILAEIVGKPIWWGLLLFVPCVNLVFSVLLGLQVAKAFGKSDGYGIGLGLLPFVFYPLLGFSDARYLGPPPS